MKITHINIGIQNIIGNKLKQNPHELDLSDNKLSFSDIAFIAKNLPLTHVVSLNLSNNFIGDEGIKYLAEVLPYTNIKSLDLSNNFIGDEGIKHLAQFLPNSQLTSLNLNHNKIADKGVESLTQILPHTAIISLDLSHNFISKQGSTLIEASLLKFQGSCKIDSMFLTEENINSVINKNFTSLNIVNGLLNKHSVKSLIEKLPNTSIKSLNLINCYIENADKQKLNKHLSSLNINSFFIKFLNADIIAFETQEIESHTSEESIIYIENSMPIENVLPTETLLSLSEEEYELMGEESTESELELAAFYF